MRQSLVRHLRMAANYPLRRADVVSHGRNAIGQSARYTREREVASGPVGDLADTHYLSVQNSVTRF
jgi:hypothetical protein